MGNERDDAENDFASAMATAERIGKEGRQAEEEDMYTVLIDRYPDRFEPYFRRALVRRTMSDRVRALEDASKAISLKPDEPACHFFRGLWHLETGSLQQSADDLEEAAKLDAALGSSYYESSARFLRVLALAALANFDDAKRESGLLSRNSGFAVNGRRWTMQQLQACIAQRQRPQF